MDLSPYNLSNKNVRYLHRLFFIIEFVNGGDLMFHMQKKRRLHEDHARYDTMLVLNIVKASLSPAGGGRF